LFIYLLGEVGFGLFELCYIRLGWVGKGYVELGYGRSF